MLPQQQQILDAVLLQGVQAAMNCFAEALLVPLQVQLCFALGTGQPAYLLWIEHEKQPQLNEPLALLSAPHTSLGQKMPMLVEVKGMGLQPLCQVQQQEHAQPACQQLPGQLLAQQQETAGNSLVGLPIHCWG